MTDTPSPPVATCAYRFFQPAMGTPVGTSVGSPRNYLARAPQVDLLKPKGIFKVYEDEPTYRHHYLKRLDDYAEDIAQQLRHIWMTNRQTLVVLCFCDLSKSPAWCHRRHFAEWFQGRTGVEVPELQPGLTRRGAPAPRLI